MPKASLSIFLRSTLFFILMVLSSVCFFISGFIYAFFVGYEKRYDYLTTWGSLIIYLSQRLCGIEYQVEGLEHLPKEACIVASSHQSAWETFALQQFLPRQTWVAKRELLWIPFFGWGLSMLRTISIHRGSPQAFEQFCAGVLKRLKQGLWIIVFPEGTRQKPHTLGFIKRGAAYVAFDTQAPLLPIVHDAGKVWPKNSWMKYPGVVRVIIGPPLHPSSFPTQDALWEALQKTMKEMFDRLENPS